jgi:AraC-like DNA-binding protein
MYSTLQFIVSQLQQQGFANQKILANTGIREAIIDDPWPFLSYEQYRPLVDNIYQLYGDPAAGLNISDTFKVRHLGIAGYAAITSSTFAEARKILMNYRILKDPHIFLSHSMGGNSWTMKLAGVSSAEEHVTRFSVEGHVMRTARFCRDLTGANDAIMAINLRYPAPEYAKLYEQLLNCSVNFEQADNSVIFNPQVLTKRLPAADQEMHALCTRECDARLALLDAQSAYKKKVSEELFRAHSIQSNGLINLYDVANRLYISPRSLRRKLLREESSFQSICNETRKDLALHYICHSALTTKEIAYSLGYSSVNNFHRAFKQWTGKPVSEFSKPTH